MHRRAREEPHTAFITAEPRFSNRRIGTGATRPRRGAALREMTDRHSTSATARNDENGHTHNKNRRRTTQNSEFKSVSRKDSRNLAHLWKKCAVKVIPALVLVAYPCTDSLSEDTDIDLISTVKRSMTVASFAEHGGATGLASWACPWRAHESGPSHRRRPMHPA